MARRSGLRTIRHSWMDPFYRKPEKRQAPPAPILSPEEQAEQRARGDAEILAFIEKKTAESNAYFDRVRESKGLDKIADHYARTAVEGDTDLNHDNIEAGE